MDILYVILKNTKITGANAEQNAYVVGPPSPLSFLSYADSYAYAAEKVGIELKTRWVLPIYHRVGEHSIHRGMLKREAVGFKTSEANVLAAPLRDELRMDLHVTLVMAFSVDAFDDTLDQQLNRLKGQLPNRVVGGNIFVNPFNADELVMTRESCWKALIPLELLYDSHVIEHRQDITEQASNLAELINLTAMQKGSRLSPIAIGYQKISSQAMRSGQRDTHCQHAFVDPLLSAAEWKFASTILDSPQVWVKQTSANLLLSTSKPEMNA